jgi:hypothetical protein
MDRYTFLDPLRVTSAPRGARRRRLGAMAALVVLVGGGLVAAALLASNAGQARYGVAAHPAVVMGGHGPSLERGGGWQHLTPLY